MLVMAGLFAGIGRAMRDVEPNGFVGIRTFWTMTNPQVWRETHLLACRTMVISALITIVVASLPIPPAWLFGAGLSSILIGVFWPMIFAYRRYHHLRTERRRQAVRNKHRFGDFAGHRIGRVKHIADIIFDRLAH